MILEEHICKYNIYIYILDIAINENMNIKAKRKTMLLQEVLQNKTNMQIIFNVFSRLLNRICSTKCFLSVKFNLNKEYLTVQLTIPSSKQLCVVLHLLN